MPKSITALILISVITTFIGGCDYQRGQPRERDILAQKKMSLDPYPLDTYLDEHIYFSKENSSGGQGVGGGGCGCN